MSAEPKGPLPLDDGHAAKKASKTSTSKRTVDSGGAPGTPPTPAVSQLSTATPTSPVPALHDVPRLAIADPKSTEEGKPRATKKRTSTPENTVPTPGPSLPVASVTPEAPAKSDVDVEKERAKREAKRQRQEEQRKRDELERQALEDARRKEEAKQRELRRQQEQARLNANADVVQDEEDDGYGDDAFEDFEAEDTPPAKAPPTVVAKPLSKAKGVPREPEAPALSSADLKRIQEAQKAENKELASTSRPSSKASSKSESKPTPEAKKNQSTASPALSIAASIAGLKQALDPRAKRAKEIRDARAFDIEKFNVFVQAPMTEGDLYLARVRRGTVRQVAVQTKDDDKSVATQTRVPELVDRSMHFPDDVGIDDVSTRLTAGSKRRGDNQTETGEPEEEEDNEDVATISSMRFLTFLEQSAQVCEQLIEENLHTHAQDDRRNATRVTLSQKSTLSRVQLFPSTQFDQSSLEKLLTGRSLTLLQFSPSVSNILVTWHTLVSDTDAPVATNKSIGVVWDLNQLARALYVLKSDDVVTTCRLSPTRDLLVLAGTEDGSVNVWDLRSRLALAGCSQLDGLDVYAPTYSTCGADSRSVEGSHQAPIVAIDVIDRRDGSGVFQFGSLDDRGLLLIWSMVDYDMTTSRDAETLLSDKCLAIGGHIKLVVSVAIDTQRQYLVLTRPALRAMVRRDPQCVIGAYQERRNSIGSSMRRKNFEDAIAAELHVGPVATMLQFFPQDPNQFLIGTTTGLVLRGNRFQANDASAAVTCYRRARDAGVAAPVPVGIAVTAIAFHPFESGYFLVGYADGRICLFSVTLPAAIATWDEVDYDTSVATLQWSPSRPAVFFASYSHGLVQTWDLLAQRHAPAFEHQLKTRKSTLHDAYPISLSSERIRTSRPSIAMCCGEEEPFQFQVHELGAEFVTRAKDEEQAIHHLLSAIF